MLLHHRKSVPHARGDEPENLVAEYEQAAVFPTPVGMNREL